MEIAAGIACARCVLIEVNSVAGIYAVCFRIFFSVTFVMFNITIYA